MLQFQRNYQRDKVRGIDRQINFVQENTNQENQGVYELPTDLEPNSRGYHSENTF